MLLMTSGSLVNVTFLLSTGGGGLPIGSSSAGKCDWARAPPSVPGLEPDSDALAFGAGCRDSFLAGGRLNGGSLFRIVVLRPISGGTVGALSLVVSREAFGGGERAALGTAIW